MTVEAPVTAGAVQLTVAPAAVLTDERFCTALIAVGVGPVTETTVPGPVPNEFRADTRNRVATPAATPSIVAVVAAPQLPTKTHVAPPSVERSITDVLAAPPESAGRLHVSVSVGLKKVPVRPSGALGTLPGNALTTEVAPTPADVIAATRKYLTAPFVRPDTTYGEVAAVERTDQVALSEDDSIR